MSQRQVALCLCSSLCSRRVVGTSDVVRHSDCRHVCDNEESLHEYLDENQHFHEDHDDHCSASGTEDCLVTLSLIDCAICVYSMCSSVFICGVAASSLVGLHALVLVSAESPLARRSDVNPSFSCHGVKCFLVGLRVSSCVYAHLVLLILEQ